MGLLFSLKNMLHTQASVTRTFLHPFPDPGTRPLTPLHLTQLQCLTRLLHAEARYFEYPAANATYAAGAALVARLGADRIPLTLHTMWYAAVSVQYFARSDYDNSNRWGIRAVQLLNASTPERLAVDVLRQTAKACVLKRQFQRARLLLVQAIKIAATTFGRRHYKYADALMDFAFYLLNVDAIAKSVQIYKEALKIRVALLGQNSLHVAIAQEDLAYALYVHHYSSGNFLSALANVDRSIKVMRALVPATHLFLASAKRVKALILEEIALEQASAPLDRRAAHNRLLLESEELHRSALRLSLDTFGEENVMTAKHYGNLGRLYQSMTKYDDAERMHNLAIKIKTDILGPWDFEVGLSIGHLASLYNYHMNRYRDAEVLYLRSIDISKFVWGESCIENALTLFLFRSRRSEAVRRGVLGPGVRLPRPVQRVRDAGGRGEVERVPDVAGGLAPSACESRGRQRKYIIIHSNVTS